MLKTILITLLGIGYTLYAVISLLDGKALDSRGKTVQIEQMEKITQITRKRSNYPEEVSYEGNVSLVTETGQTVTLKKHLSVPLTTKIMQGLPVLIRYLPDKPTTARMEDEKGADTSDIGLGFIVFVVGVLWFRKKLHAPVNLG